MSNLKIICEGEYPLNLKFNRKSLEESIEKYKSIWVTPKLPNMYSSLSEAQLGLIDNRINIFEPLYKLGKNKVGDIVVLDTYKSKK